MVRHAIAAYVGEQSTCVLPHQVNEQVYSVFIVHMHVVFFVVFLLLLSIFYCIYFNALTLNILYVFLHFYVSLLYTCLSENSSDELML